jgi:hypothetical protein
MLRDQPLRVIARASRSIAVLPSDPQIDVPGSSSDKVSGFLTMADAETLLSWPPALRATWAPLGKIALQANDVV